MNSIMEMPRANTLGQRNARAWNWNDDWRRFRVIRAIDPRESLDASRHLTLDNAGYAAATSDNSNNKSAIYFRES